MSHTKTAWDHQQMHDDALLRDYPVFKGECEICHAPAGEPHRDIVSTLLPFAP